MGKALEKILPTTRFRTFGYVWSFNPGPFNIKEHVIITVMGGVVMLGAYSTDIIATQKFFYSQPIPFSYQILLAMGTQLFGFSLAGILRRFLVWPSAMIWPGALVNSALFNTLHRNYNRRETKHMSRQRFFFIVCGSSFLWYWLPGYLWTGLSIFTWVCWIAPNNVVVNQLFGGLTGLGMSTLTFDWSMIAFIGSPLVTPVCRLLFHVLEIRVEASFFFFFSGGPKPILLLVSSCSFGSSPLCCTVSDESLFQIGRGDSY
jgi:hypothetical protein